MADEIFKRSMRIARPAAAVFAWHERPGAFGRLCPPWERVEVTRHVGGIRDGARVSLRTKVGPVWARWEIEHRDYVAGRQFRDVLLSGPFAKWEHLHRIEPAGAAACVLTDEIHYRLPLGLLGRWGGAAFTRAQLERMFEYRHAVTKADLEHATPGAPKCVLVSGASGMVGRALQAFLETQGHTVRTLVRRAAKNDREFHWEPAAGTIDAAALAGVDAVIHLGGENVAAGRWTAARKAAIRSSRVEGTRTLAKAIAARPVDGRPEVFVSAAAVGFYGSRGDALAGEDVGAGTGFLVDVCVAWEGELAAVEALGVRTVALRTGVVLSPAGGALAKMLPAFLAGVGGRLASGRQWMSWITPDDLCAMYLRAVLDPTWRGAFNAVAPGPVTNAEFAATLAHVLRRPTLLPVPAAGLKLIFGEMAEAMLLTSTRAVPERATQAGFAWRHPELDSALRHVLGRKG
ncbi:MAG: TIGR01777 family oxidoreductase [Lacunisphaera sp.]|nr:TIGR01777 family oxidoreductase [Lacunisphaera sp.]